MIEAQGETAALWLGEALVCAVSFLALVPGQEFLPPGLWGGMRVQGTCFKGHVL